jgi:hypothetical protein
MSLIDRISVYLKNFDNLSFSGKHCGISYVNNYNELKSTHSGDIITASYKMTYETKIIHLTISFKFRHNSICIFFKPKGIISIIRIDIYKNKRINLSDKIYFRSNKLIYNGECLPDNIFTEYSLYMHILSKIIPFIKIRDLTLCTLGFYDLFHRVQFNDKNLPICKFMNNKIFEKNTLNLIGNYFV